MPDMPASLPVVPVFLGQLGVKEHLRRHGIISRGMQVGKYAAVRPQHGSMTHHSHVGFQADGLSGLIPHLELQTGILPDVQRSVSLPNHLSSIGQTADRVTAGILPDGHGRINGPRIVRVRFQV